jgi:hypothetical protein
VPPVVVGDFDPDGARRIVVDRVPGRYLGHPSTALVDGGRGVLCAYPEGHGRGPIVLRRSDDGGRTWGPRLPVPENFATSEETPTLFRVADPASGRERLVLWSGLKPARRAVSEDEGRTWTPLTPAGEWGGIVLMSSGFADGPRFRAFFHDDGRFFGATPLRPRRFAVYGTSTADGGLTWTAPEVIAAEPGFDLCEPGHVRSPDGATDLLLLRENSRRGTSRRIVSTDRGRTWGPPVPLPPSLTGDRHVARYAADGRLVVVFRDMAEGSATRGDFVAWYGSFAQLLAGEGGRRVRLLDNRHEWDCGYAGLELLPDGVLLTVTYGRFTEGEAPYVVALRFTPAELDRL